jgi:hypothetical protein
MLDALALQPVLASSYPVWQVFALRDDVLLPKIPRRLEHCGAVLFKVLAESDWRAGGKSANKF